MRAKILTLLAFLPLAGCSSVPSLLYKIEIQQGNVITQEMVDKLKPGMTRSQVRFVLGSPMISDIFHSHRWDYVYRLEQRGRLMEQRQLTVFFEGDEVVRTEGSFAPPVAFTSPPSESEAGMASFTDTTGQSAPHAEAETGEETGEDAPVLSAIATDDVRDSGRGAVLGGASIPGKAPVLPTLQPVVPRQVPLRAADRGHAGVDLPKE
ncbi:outer membrane protein assembly factor BamE [Nitrosovibrio sp. Nv17]|uniref:outer membrane protein assembly factor BamE n=1 Tax=Nitrosovibrio sp. Nv17 TaxID=1855339 RepID=UPI0009085CAD|nr:outer membrane protein assembly factor BamE [Nitrosovibrio sp. Nv17]SFW10740.1 outer membrane protein assembly factor BamE [Nitrosovibrio sp. Nv17]